MPKVIYTHFVVGVAEMLIHELMLEAWPGCLPPKSTGRQVATTINYKRKTITYELVLM